jgi:putative ABC transport system permease protein
MNFTSLWQVIFLLIGTFLAWWIAEYATSYFRERIESEIKTVVSSDIEVSGRTLPSAENRIKMREIAKRYNARMTEWVEFPFVIEQAGTGSRFVQVEVRIVDESYPLYGKLDYTGSFSGVISNAEVWRFLSGGVIDIGNKTLPLTGTITSFPEMSANPFSQNKNIFIRDSLLSFNAIAWTGSLYRYDYEAGFAVARKSDIKAMIQDLRQLYQWDQFRIREQRADGGNFTDIANTVNDFLGAILFASMLIVFSSFLITFLHFVQERKDIGRILYRMGISEKELLVVFLGRLFLVTGGIAGIFLFMWWMIPGLILNQFLQFWILTGLLLIAMFWMVLETILSEYSFFQKHTQTIRYILIGIITILVGIYAYLAGGSLLPILYAGISLVVMERVIWLIFRYFPFFIEKCGFTGKMRFSLLDVLRSFVASPVLGKISFSIFFLLSGTLTGVFLFSLSFRETLIDITRSPIDAYVINISSKDYTSLVTWNQPEQFYSTIRARIDTINNISLLEHIGGNEVPRQFSREFNITDSSDSVGSKVIIWRPAITKTEVTVDADFAKNLDIGIGDSITFTLAGRSFPFEIVGVRQSKRSGITPFFYFQIAPNAIEWAPKTYFLTADIWNQTLDEWKQRVIADSWNHVVFIDVRPILDQVIQYSQMVLAGVLGLFFYIASIGFLAFLMSERTFFALKIRKVQLYRLLGATKSDGYRILFFESLLGNVLPLFMGVTLGIGVFAIFIQTNPILRLSFTSTVISLIVIGLFFMGSYLLTRKFLSGKIEKTQPQIGNTNR